MNINMPCSIYTYAHIYIRKNTYVSFILPSIFSKVGFLRDKSRLVAGDFFSNEKERGNKAYCALSLVALMQVFNPCEI